MTKHWHLIVCLLLLICLVTACGPSAPIEAPAPSQAAPATTQAAAPSAQTPAEPAAVSNEEVTLTYFCGALGDCIIQSFNDCQAYQKAMEITGINLEFVHAAQGQQNEQLGVMIASRDLSDIVELGDTYRYPKGWDGLVADGLAMRLNELMEEHAPDFMALINSDKELLRQTITDEGTIWCIPCLQPEGEMPWRGMSIRKDILDAHNMAIPETVSEIKEALQLFKSLGMEAPMYFKIAPANAFDDGPIVSAYGVGPFFYLDGEQIKYGPMEDGYKAFLTEMNEWYAEGLLDKESPVREGKDVDAMVVNSQIGLLLRAGYGPTLTTDTNGKAQNPDFELWPFPNPTLEKGDRAQMRNYSFLNKGINAIISTTCKNPEAAARFLNFGFTDEGFYLYNYGIEGVAWEMVDGKPQFTDMIINSEEGPWVNIRDKYKRHIGPYNRDSFAFPMTDFEANCMEQWNKADPAMNEPMISMNAEESERNNILYADVEVYIKEMLWKFVSGEESLDNYDDFRDQLRKMGIEEILEIRNAALVRYYNRELS